MDPLLNEFTQLPWLPIQTVAARMIAALVCGALVGFEREWRNHPAGLRTHMLVCLASACVAILAIEISHMAPFDNESTRIDPLRLIEAVTGGVAFLAAGFIVFTNGRVRGLTTGAGMWLAGSIGLACGLGALHIAAIATGLSILVLWILGHVERGLSEDDDPGGKYGD